MLAHILHDRHLAEELLQELFLHLWSEARNLIEAKGSVAAWLVMNARFLALERVRADKLAQESPATKHAKALRTAPAGPSGARPGGRMQSAPARAKPPASPGWPAAWTPSPEEVAQVDERLTLLQKVMSQLPKAQSAALELSVFGGYSEEEIAREFNEPLGKVRTTLCAAVTFLRHRRRAVVGSWAANI